MNGKESSSIEFDFLLGNFMVIKIKILYLDENRI